MYEMFRFNCSKNKKKKKIEIMKKIKKVFPNKILPKI